MDITQPPYSQNRFNQISNQITNLVRSCGFDPNLVAVIPISGLKADNLGYRSEKMSWFQGWTRQRLRQYFQFGRDNLTFAQALDGYSEYKRPIDKPLRMPIQKAYQVLS